MATGNDIGLAEPSTITKRLATVTQNWNSTVRHQELQTIAGAESTLEIARVLAAEPASTDYGVVVRTVPRSPSQWATLSNSTIGASTSTPILSSGTTRPYISAYTIVSTEAGPIVGGFFEGSTLLWPVTLWGSGGQLQAQQAVAPPGFLFAGSSGRPISFNIIAGSTGVIRGAITYRME